MSTIMELHPPCVTVLDEFGPPEAGLLSDPDYRLIAADVAHDLEQIEELTARDFYTITDSAERCGLAADRVLTALGCNSCSVAVDCQVRTELERDRAEGQRAAVFNSQLRMLRESPAWLTKIRLAGQPEMSRTVLSLQNDSEALAAAVNDGRVDLGIFLGVSNESGKKYTKADVPELQAIDTLKPDTEIQAHTITTERGKQFEVIDASNAVGFTKEPLGVHEQAILFSKLLNRFSEVDAQDNPQILSCDSKMQKPLFKLGGVQVYEMRMSGKNRLYFAVDNSNPQTAPRVTILGSHGGDENTQRAFLDVTLAHK